MATCFQKSEALFRYCESSVHLVYSFRNPLMIPTTQPQTVFQEVIDDKCSQKAVDLHRPVFAQKNGDTVRWGEKRTSRRKNDGQVISLKRVLNLDVGTSDITC